MITHIYLLSVFKSQGGPSASVISFLFVKIWVWRKATHWNVWGKLSLKREITSLSRLWLVLRCWSYLGSFYFHKDAELYLEMFTYVWFLFYLYLKVSTCTWEFLKLLNSEKFSAFVQVQKSLQFEWIYNFSFQTQSSCKISMVVQRW